MSFSLDVALASMFCGPETEAIPGVKWLEQRFNHADELNVDEAMLKAAAQLGSELQGMQTICNRYR